MATITNLQETVFGDKRIAIFDIALGTYAAGGVSLLPADIGLKAFETVLIAPSAGYSLTYDYSAKKVMAFRQPASTSTGVISAPITVSMSGVTLSGPATSGPIAQLSTDTATGVLSKISATTRSIPPATFGIPVPTAVIAPVFTGGTATTAVLAQATGTLSNTARVMVIGT